MLDRDEVRELEGGRTSLLDDQPVGPGRGGAGARAAPAAPARATTACRWSSPATAATASGWSSTGSSASATWRSAPLDPRLGKVPNINSASVLEDGWPVLIIDVEDLVRSIDNLLGGRRLKQLAGRGGRGHEAARAEAGPRRGRLDHGPRAGAAAAREPGLRGRRRRRRRRRLERGPRRAIIDLVISDVDMPRMDGIELVRSIKQDPRLQVDPGGDRLVQGPRGGPDARPRRRRRRLPDQEQLPRPDVPRHGGRPDRRGRGMRIGIVNDLAHGPRGAAAGRARRCRATRSPGSAARRRRGGGRRGADRPDLILMDLIMPGIDGVEATRRIMAESPCPILVVTATVSGHIGKVYEAMGHGALDAVDTPVLGPSGRGRRRLGPCSRRSTRSAKLIGKSPSRPAPTVGRPRPADRRPSGEPSLHPLVVLGASTGGPDALAEILAGLPATGTPASSSSSTSTPPSPRAWRSGSASGPGSTVELVAEGDGPAAGVDPPGRHQRPPRPGRGPAAPLRRPSRRTSATGPRSTSSSRASPGTGPSRASPRC